MDKAGRWQLRLPGSKRAQVDLFDFTRLGESLASGERFRNMAPETEKLTWMYDAELSIRPDLNKRLVPARARAQLFEEQGINLDRFQPVDLERYRLCID